MDDAAAFGRFAGGRAGPGLALVDPFKSVHEIWPSFCRAFGALCGGHDALILAFQFNPGAVEWPDAPHGLALVTTIDDGRYHLASYATPDMCEATRAALGTLGWQGRTPANRRFDVYAMADYSGAQSASTQREHIVVAEFHAEGAEPTPHRELTRDGLRAWLVRRIAENDPAERRFLFGIDHQFGWPGHLLAACGLGGRPWREVLELLAEPDDDRPALRHPSECCVSFNEWFAARHNGEQLFFSRTRQGPYKHLPPRATAFGGKPVFRRCEETIQAAGFRPKPAAQIGDNGAVGGQTICGLLQLRLLFGDLDRAGLSERLAVWPFDGLALEDAAYEGKHVLVEIYPTLLRGDLPQTDWNDARASAEWAHDRDRSGVLAKKMGSPKVHVGHFASLTLGRGSSMLVSQSMITPMSADAEWRQSLRIRPPAFRLENHACAP